MTTDSPNETTMEVTNFDLGRRQKNELRMRAVQQGTTVAEEIRNAVDAYLMGVTSGDLDLLDVASRQVQADIAELAGQLDLTNRKADRIFAELEQLRGGAPTELASEIPVPAKAGARRGAH